MARPRNPENLQLFTCYLPEKDLEKIKKLARKSLVTPAAIVRLAVRAGLESGAVPQKLANLLVT